MWAQNTSPQELLGSIFKCRNGRQSTDNNQNVQYFVTAANANVVDKYAESSQC